MTASITARRRAAGYRCSGCGALAGKWAGRCHSCSAWNTLEVAPVAGCGGLGRAPVRATEASGEAVAAVPTGLTEFDRVLNGGLVPGSVTLVGGEPGIGKSTLLLQVAGRVAEQGARVLYASAEESVGQVRARAERLGTLHEELWLLAESSVEGIIGHIGQLQPDLVVVDSVQTVGVAGDAAPGSVTQVREAALQLTAVAKEAGVALVLVGHVTKDGSLAGPRQLEHLVDTVLSFEGDRHHALRLLRSAKHRFGPTQELGLFEMTDAGLLDVADPSGLFLADRCPGATGSVVFPLVEGQRPLLVELQALLVPSQAPTPRRSAQGVNAGRLALLLAVLGRRVNLPVIAAEVYALAVGGVEVTEPGADLALALAVVSALSGVALAPGLVVCGEVGLTGEVRAVRNLARRLAEAERAGFTRAIVPASSPRWDGALHVSRVASVAEALVAAELAPARPVPGAG